MRRISFDHKPLLLALFVIVTIPAVPAATFAAEKLPPGFIALSEFSMDWASAKGFCQQKGGKLPLVANSTSVGKIPRTPTIDGFGTSGAPWPSGLPSGVYWTNAEYAHDPGYSWLVYDLDGKIIVTYPDYRNRSNDNRVVCVP